MNVVEDIDRPDILKQKPKMQKICDDCKTELDQIVPYLSIHTDDNLMSSITIRGTFDDKSEWSYGIFHNGEYFIIHITPEKGKRYYTDGEKVTLEQISTSHKLKTSNIRKYTATPEKVIAKLKAWIMGNISE